MDEPTSAQWHAIQDLALDIAAEAGALILERRRAGLEIAETKSSVSDIVTAADRASEDLVRERILAARPDDGLLGEEGSDHDGTSGYRWVVDPIDGTVNYAHEIPQYAVSIGVEYHGEVVCGVVCSPAQQLTYAAVRGGGATCNGVPLEVAQTVPRERRVIGTGFSYERSLRESQARTFARLLPRIADVRRMGSCALDLCSVAHGRLDGYVEEGIGGAWDYAGGGLVLTEAGGRMEVLTGVAGRTLVLGAPAASYDDFRSLVEECGFLGSADGRRPAEREQPGPRHG